MDSSASVAAAFIALYPYLIYMANGHFAPQFPRITQSLSSLIRPL
jgi:hypothetical protein